MLYLINKIKAQKYWTLLIGKRELWFWLWNLLESIRVSYRKTFKGLKLLMILRMFIRKCSTLRRLFRNLMSFRILNTLKHKMRISIQIILIGRRTRAWSVTDTNFSSLSLLILQMSRSNKDLPKSNHKKSLDFATYFY